MNKNHEKFLQHLDASVVPVMVVADWLTRQNKWVTLPPHRLPDAPSSSMHPWGDIYMADSFMGQPKRVEVKGRNLDFTDAASYPYPTVMVCEVNAWDKVSPPPEFFFITNKSLTHVAVVDGQTFLAWGTQSRRDDRYEGDAQWQVCYVCDKELVTFHSLDEV